MASASSGSSPSAATCLSARAIGSGGGRPLPPVERGQQQAAPTAADDGAAGDCSPAQGDGLESGPVGHDATFNVAHRQYAWHRAGECKGEDDVRARRAAAAA